MPAYSKVINNRKQHRATEDDHVPVHASGRNRCRDGKEDENPDDEQECDGADVDGKA